MAVDRQYFPQTPAERSAVSDQAMLDAAHGLILEFGICKTTLALIGERSGYSRGLVTHRFGSKAGLFGALSKSIGRKWLVYLKEEVGDKTGLSAMLSSVDALHRWVADSPDDARVMQVLFNDSASPGSDLPLVAAKAHERHHADIVRWIKDGQANGEIRDHLDVQAAASHYVAYVSGITYLWLIDAETFDFASANAEMKRQLLASLSADPAHRVLA